MLNSINNKSIQVVKPASKIILNNIQKFNSNNIHLSTLNSSSINSINCKIPTMLNETSIPSTFNSSSKLLFNRDMSSSIPKILPKNVVIDSEEKIELIKNKKAKMARPFTWEEMKFLVEKNSVEVMVRTPADERVYMNWLKVLKSKYTSINDYIKIIVMGYSETVDEKTGAKTAGKPKFNTEKLIFESDDVYYVIRRNDFPYWLEPNIEHYVLWTSVEFTREHAGKILNEKFPDSDLIYFTNTPDKKSVKGVCHYQIFVRPKETSPITLSGQKLNELKNKNFKLN